MASPLENQNPWAFKRHRWALKGIADRVGGVGLCEDLAARATTSAYTLGVKPEKLAELGRLQGDGAGDGVVAAASTTNLACSTRAPEASYRPTCER